MYSYIMVGNSVGKQLLFNLYSPYMMLTAEKLRCPTLKTLHPLKSDDEGQLTKLGEFLKCMYTETYLATTLP